MPEPLRPTRRGLLRTAATALVGSAAGAAAALPLTATADGSKPSRRAGFVLVHGANGNAASFTPVAAALAAAGHLCLAVDLPGHGIEANFPPAYQAPQDLEALAAAPSPILSTVTLEDNADRVEAAVRRMAEHGPVILLGHSMGGATITRVANRIPERIARLVYLTAFCCTKLRTVLDCFDTEEGAGSLLAGIEAMPTEVPGISRTNWRGADAKQLKAIRAAMAADYDDAAFGASLNLFEPDEAAAVATDDARGHAETWGRVPRSYIRCTADQAIPVPLQDRMIAEADTATPGNGFDVHDLDAPHLGPADPAGLAEILTGLAR